MSDGYVLLTEKEEMWARMLMEVLEDHGIPCAALPVCGAGFSMRTGIQERWNVLVPHREFPHAKELLQELFSADEEL